MRESGHRTAGCAWRVPVSSTATVPSGKVDGRHLPDAHLPEPLARPPRRLPVELPPGSDLDLRQRLALQIVDDDAVEVGKAGKHNGAEDLALKARHLHVGAEAEPARPREDPCPAVAAVRMGPVQACVEPRGADVEDPASRRARIRVALVEQVRAPPEAEEGPAPGLLRGHDLDVDLRRLAGEGHSVRGDPVPGERVEHDPAVLVVAEEAMALHPHGGVEPAQVCRDVVGRAARRDLARVDKGCLVLRRIGFDREVVVGD